MKHFRLWIVLVIVLLIVVLAVVLGRGWIYFETKWDPADNHWGPHVDKDKWNDDWFSLMKAVGLRKDPNAPRPTETER